GSTSRPVAPSTIAGRLHPKDSPPKIPERVQVHGSETIGYETGRYGDRRAGGGRTGGVYTESSVGVGVGDPRMPPSAPPRSTDSLSVQVELENAALPEGRFAQPVAGFLYFPAPAKKGALELTWYGADGAVRLTLRK